MVYVDPLRDWGWKLGPSCHLLADTLAELHKFAARLGLKRSWAQVSNCGVPHYDLVASRRKKAITLGALDCQTPEQMRLFIAVNNKWKQEARNASRSVRSQQ